VTQSQNSSEDFAANLGLCSDVELEAHAAVLRRKRRRLLFARARESCFAHLMLILWCAAALLATLAPASVLFDWLGNGTLTVLLATGMFLFVAANVKDPSFWKEHRIASESATESERLASLDALFVNERVRRTRGRK
jgi:hypothetical protein